MSTNKQLNGIVIREATTDDVIGIVYVQATTWISQYPNPDLGITEEDIRAIDWHGKVPQWQHMVKSPDYTVWVVGENDHIYGFATVAYHQNTYELYALDVLPEHQNQGIGSELLQAVLEEIRTDIFLQVATYNKDAQRLYKRYGFAETGTQGVFKLPGGKYIPTLHMRREGNNTAGNAKIEYVFRSELARKSGVRESTIKWYTELGLLPYTQPDKKRRRHYPLDTALQRLEYIARLRNDGYSLQEIHSQLQQSSG